MKTKQPTEETDTDRGVSPVIGVILMVAITVILAAVIAAFVLDIGPGEPDPSAAVEVSGEYDVELTALDNADAVVPVQDGTIELGDEDPLTTTGQIESYSEDTENLQAVRTDNPDDLDGQDVEDDTDANAIVENLD